MKQFFHYLAQWLTTLGWVKLVRQRNLDPRVDGVVSKILAGEGAYLVFTDTARAMRKIHSAMRKNGIPVIAVGRVPGSLPAYDLAEALELMARSPEKCQVVICAKALSLTGWRIPPEYPQYWGKVHLLSSCVLREPELQQARARIWRHGQSHKPQTLSISTKVFPQD